MDEGAGTDNERPGVVSTPVRSWTGREAPRRDAHQQEETGMAHYLIAFNDEWTPELTTEELRERGTAARAVIAEMTTAGVFVFSDGGLDASTALCSVDASSGSPVFTDGPYVETKEHLGGFAVVDVADDEAARYWAGRIAVAVGWPQEVHRFPRGAAAQD
jgi:hypothetical protein